MKKYRVFYYMRKGGGSVSRDKIIECESESTAIEIAKIQGLRDYPGYEFDLKNVRSL